MHPRRRQRLVWVLALLAGVALAAVLGTLAFRQNLMYFHTPSDIAEGAAPDDLPFRLGGLVVPGSVERDADSLAVRFRLADCAHETPVVFEGILPDLFREGQGIVSNGRLNAEGVFVAEQVLAKHDENYMPPELAKALDGGNGHSCDVFRPRQAERS